MGGIRLGGIIPPPAGLVPFVMYGAQPSTATVNNDALFMVSETPGQDLAQISLGASSVGTGSDITDPDPKPDGTFVVAATSPIGAGAAALRLLDMSVAGPSTGLSVLDTNPSLLVLSMQPSWHPTADLIVYRTMDNSPNECQVRTITSAGGTPTTLKTISRASGNIYRPQFSASGDFIAYVLAGANSDVYVMNADGTGATNVATLGAVSPRLGWEFSWARTQDVLVYQKQNGVTVEVRKVNADGTGDTLLYTDTHLEFNSHLTRRSWSQDDSLVFKMVHDSGDANAQYQLYAIDSTGGGAAAVSPQRKTTLFSNDCLPQTYGGRVYYASSDAPPNDDSDHFQVYSLLPDGSDWRLEADYATLPDTWISIAWIGAWEATLNQQE